MVAYSSQRNLLSTTETAAATATFTKDMLSFSSANGPIILLEIPSDMVEGRRRY